MNSPTSSEPIALYRNPEVGITARAPLRARHRRTGPQTAGFTLVEILVALFIFALITTTLFGSFTGVFSSASDLDANLVHFESGSLCLSHIQRELREIFVHLPPAYQKPGINSEPSFYRIMGSVSEIDGKSYGRLRFTALTQLPIDGRTARPPLAVIYYVDQREDGRLALRRALRANDTADREFEPQTADATLCEDLLEFELAYMDSAGELQKNWDSESEDFAYATPRAIKIALSIGTQEAVAAHLETSVALPAWRPPLES